MQSLQSEEEENGTIEAVGESSTGGGGGDS